MTPPDGPSEVPLENLGAVDWSGYDLRQKAAWVEQGSGSRAIDPTHGALDTLGAEFRASDERVRTALQGMQVGWQGMAATSASEALTRVAAAGGAGGDASAGGTVPVGSYGQSFDGLKNRFSYHEGPLTSWLGDWAPTAKSAAMAVPMFGGSALVGDEMVKYVQNLADNRRADDLLQSHEIAAHDAVGRFPTVTGAPGSTLDGGGAGPDGGGPGTNGDGGGGGGDGNGAGNAPQGDGSSTPPGTPGPAPGPQAPGPVTPAPDQPAPDGRGDGAGRGPRNEGEGSGAGTPQAPGTPGGPDNGSPDTARHDPDSVGLTPAEVAQPSAEAPRATPPTYTPPSAPAPAPGGPIGMVPGIGTGGGGGPARVTPLPAPRTGSDFANSLLRNQPGRIPGAPDGVGGRGGSWAGEPAPRGGTGAPGRYGGGGPMSEPAPGRSLAEPGAGRAGTGAGTGAGPGGYAPMGGAGAGRGSEEEHRNRYLLPSSEAFDVDLPHTPPVLGAPDPDEDE